MIKGFKANIFVEDISRKCVSSYGNPSYWVDFSTKDYRLCELNISIGYTASNAQCGYTASNFVGKECKIEYHFTRKGALIIDTMR